MPSELRIDLIVNDKGEAIIKDFTQKSGKHLKDTEKHTKSLTTSMDGLKKVAIGVGAAFLSWKAAQVVKQTANSFLDAAKEAEGYQVRLKTLLGSQAEGNRLFKEMSVYAGRVPFQYKEIMSASTALSGVMKGGVDEIKQWMPMIGDLAAVSGLSIEQTTSQVIRMYSAGAGAADMFRERGILAMMGFQAGAEYSVEQTRKMMFDSWNATNSKFKGVTEDLAETWDGLTSMYADKWFQMRNKVMDAAVFDILKEGASDLLKEINRLEDEGKLDEWAKATARGVIVSMKAILEAVSFVPKGIYGMKGAWASLNESITRTLSKAAGFTPKARAIFKEMADGYAEHATAAAQSYLATTEHFDKILAKLEDYERTTQQTNNEVLLSTQSTTRQLISIEEHYRNKQKALQAESLNVSQLTREEEIAGHKSYLDDRMAQSESFWEYSRFAYAKDTEVWQTEQEKKAAAYEKHWKALQSLAKGYSGDIQDVTSDVLFDALTGKMKSLEEYWETLWKNMLRHTTNYVSRIAVEAAAPMAIEFIGDLIFGSAAAGRWQIDKDQALLVHKGEMVIPESLATKIRSGFDNFEDMQKAAGSTKENDPEAARRFATNLATRWGRTALSGILSGIRPDKAITSPGTLMYAGIGAVEDEMARATGYEATTAKTGASLGGVVGMVGLGLLGGPAAGLAGYALGRIGGRVLGNAIGDALDVRDYEGLRDTLENYGWRQRDIQDIIENLPSGRGRAGGDGFGSMGATDIDRSDISGIGYAKEGAVITSSGKVVPAGPHGVPVIAHPNEVIAPMNKLGGNTYIFNFHAGSVFKGDDQDLEWLVDHMENKRIEREKLYHG